MNLKKILLGAAGVAVLGVGGWYLFKSYVDADHTGVPLVPPAGEPIVKAAPDNWETAKVDRMNRKKAYIKANKIAFDWFADFPFSQTDGTPLIIFKLLPKIDPERWQGGDKRRIKTQKASDSFIFTPYAQKQW